MRSLLSIRMPLLAAWLVVSAGGCANRLTDALPYWPWGDTERTTIVTPGQRIEKLKALGNEAADKHADEQDAIANDLALQIQKEEDPLIREEIVCTLGKLKTPTSHAVIRAALKDYEPSIRMRACQLLAGSEDPEVPAALADLVQNDADFDVRLAATESLAKFKDPVVMPTLALALDDSNPAMQHRAMQSLKTNSGEDFGNDVSAWRQYARGETPTKREISVAERIRSISPF